ncbi:SpoIIE family protein phosphatase [Deltaproteobacteria bacterium TL4]
MEIFHTTRALCGDSHCGDMCYIKEYEQKTILTVIDGLGHGIFAEAAAFEAVAYLTKHDQETMKDIFFGCSAAINSTRGVAMGIGIVNLKENTLTFGGIGNVELIIVGKNSKRSGSDPGIVGVRYRKLNPVVLPFEPGDLAVLYTDGIHRNMDLSQYADVNPVDLSKLAERILNDWGKAHDDQGILLCKRELL